MVWTIQKKVNVGLILLLITLISLGFSSLKLYNRQTESRATVVKTYAVINYVAGLSSMLKVSKDNIYDNIGHLETLTRDDERLRQRIATIRAAMTSLFADYYWMLADKQKKHPDAARQASMTKKDVELIKHVQVILGEMKDVEDRLLDRQIGDLAVQTNRTKLLSFLFVLVGTLSVAMISFALRKDIGRREAVEADLRRLRDELESLVQERTSDLRLTNDALSRERGFIKALVSSISDGIVACDPQGTVNFYNASFEELCGDGTRSSLPAGEPRNDLPAPSTSLPPSRTGDIPLSRALSGERVYNQEMVIVREDQPARTVLASGRRVVDEDGNNLGAVVTLRDITDRKWAEDQMREQFQNVSSLRQIDLAITSSFNLKFILDVALDQVLSRLGVDAACVCLLHPKTLTLTHKTGKGFMTDEITRTRISIKEGLAGEAVFTREGAQADDLREAEDEFGRPDLVRKERFVGYAVEPLVAKGQCKGVLEVFYRRRFTADPVWLGFLETLAGQIAIAVDNIQMFESLQQSNIELTLAYDKALEGWVKALDLRDHETEGHTQRVTDLALRLAEHLGMHGDDLSILRKGALLHDIGKIGIPDQILLKPGPLTEAEREIIQQHPQLAYDLLSPIEYLRPSLDVPLYHHEKWDGTGYPRKLKGEQIPFPARVFAVADVFDALRSNRPYRAGWPEARVMDHIRSLSGTHFDPAVVEAFMEMWNSPVEADTSCTVQSLL